MKQLQYILLTLLAIFVVACQADEDALNDKGFLSFAIGQDVSVTTKADEYNPELLALKISDSTGKEIKTVTGSVQELNVLKIELVAGEYTVEVYSNNYDGNSAFGENGAYYYGSTKVSVTKGGTTTANITCTLANVKVTVNFDTQLVGQLNGRTITVQVTSKTQSVTARDFSSANTENNVAFFPVGDLEVAIAIMNGGTKEHGLTHAITEVKARDHYILNIKLQETGTENITVQVDPSMQEYSYEFTVSQKPTNQGTLSANAWAKFAYLTAENVTSASGTNLKSLKFQYKEKDKEYWEDANTIFADETYSATATNLKSGTVYEYHLTDGLNFVIEGGEFTTEFEKELTDGNFDNWTTNENIIYPGADISNLYWDTSNKGANTMSTFTGIKNPTQELTTPVVKEGSSAAQLKSDDVWGFFAAASLYTGSFGAVSGTNATVNFGKPFTSRPIALKGYYQYTPKNVDKVGSNLPPDATVSKGQPDQCSIYIALAKKTYSINNGDENTFINFEEDNNIIAYGNIDNAIFKAALENGYIPFTIPLKYKKQFLNESPTHIIVVCSASKYGDYMTGGVGSTLYVDEFSLEYEGEPTIWE